MKRSTKRLLFVAVLVAISVGAIVAVSIIRPDWFLLAVLAVALVLFVAAMATFASLLSFIEWVIWPRGVRGADARGNDIELRDIKKMPSGDEITKQMLACGRKRVRFVAPSGWRPWFLLLWSLAVTAYLSLFFFGVSLPSWSGWMITCIIVPGGILLTRVCRTLGLEMQASSLLAIDRCASCGYQLCKLPVEVDSCTICPECGAAWKLHRCPGCGHDLGVDDSQECPECGWKRGDRHNASGYSSAARSD